MNGKAKTGASMTRLRKSRTQSAYTIDGRTRPRRQSGEKEESNGEIRKEQKKMSAVKSLSWLIVWMRMEVGTGETKPSWRKPEAASRRALFVSYLA